MTKEREKEGRVLKATVIGKFTLLNSEKLGRVLDLVEDLVQPKDAEEAGILAEARKLGDDEAVLALYDRLGGAIKLGERKLSMGTFYDFAARKPIAKPDLTEKDFEDEYVLVPKKVNKTKKAETVGARIKRLEAKSKKAEKK